MNLPDAPEFVSFPPSVALPVMRRYIEQLRRSFPKSLPTAEERWRAKTAEEFRL